jgi:hypothetical protein
MSTASWGAAAKAAAPVCLRRLSPADTNYPGSFRSPPPAPGHDTNYSVHAIGDIDGDGRPDLIWQHELSRLLVCWLMEGTSPRMVEGLTPAAVPDTNWHIVGPR